MMLILVFYLVITSTPTLAIAVINYQQIKLKLPSKCVVRKQ